MLTAQNEAAIWYFGENAGLDFRSGTPVALEDGQLNTFEGCASISDFNGDLLFYTDGINVWDKTHNIMPNGTGLLGHPSSTQSGIIVPKPGDSNTYYIFTTDAFSETDGIHYSIVDISLNAGLGDVLTKNIPLDISSREKITAVAHANGTDYWVVSHSHNGDKFIAYLITNTGVNTNPVITNIGINYIDSPFFGGSAGYMKFSPNGEFLAIANDVGGPSFQIVRFNTNTGIFSEDINMSDFFPPLTLGIDRISHYGLEFSPDSKKIYATYKSQVIRPQSFKHSIYQFDISNYDAASIQSSIISITSTSNTFSYGALQLGIDGKIYVALSGQSFLSVINNPNETGFACGYVENGVSLGSKKSQVGLPPFITTFFNVGIKAKNFCEGDATEFSVNVSEPITSISWDFGDGNTSTMENPVHTYATTGTYTVNVIANTATESKPDTKEITIHKVPIANPINNWIVCSTTATHEFDLSIRDAEILGTQDPTLFRVSYYPSLSDAQNRSNALPKLYTNTLVTETIYARIANANNVSCGPITNFNITVKKTPILHTVKDWIVCDTDTDGLYAFDFTTKDTEVFNGQDTSVFAVRYYTNNADAQADTNPIVGLYTNTSNSQDIYFRIFNTNTTTPECIKIGDFNIQVLLEVTANAPTNFFKCDDDNDGFMSFDLSTKNIQVLGTQNAANYTITYHTSQVDADMNLNALNTTNYTNTIAFTQTIYVRIQNKGSKDCYNTTFFNLIISKTPILQTVSNWKVCDTNNDGVFSFDFLLKNTEILGNQATTDFTISYYATQAEAQTKTNSIQGIWENTTKKQEIFYRIESK